MAAIFKIKGTKGKVDNVAGSKVIDGQISNKHKFRIVRHDQVIAENLKLHSLKRVAEDVSEVD